MAKSVMPKQTSGGADSSEWDRLSNGEPQLLGPYRTSYRIVAGAAERGTEICFCTFPLMGGHRYRSRRRAIDSVLFSSPATGSASRLLGLLAVTLFFYGALIEGQKKAPLTRG
jgi:hypothetical protein